MSSERLLPHAALSAHAHNRIGLRRTDDAWLDERMADPATRVLVVAGNRLRPVDGAVEWVTPDEAPDGTLVLLGDRDDVVHLAVIVAPDDAPGDAEEWVPLRDVLTACSRDGTPDQAPLLMHAIGLAEWHHATRFCPRCGGTLVSRAAGHELRCTQCDRAQFPRTDPAVIMAITHGEGDDEAILLGRNRAWPAGRWSTLAGFCEPGETLEDAVRREVDEEVGVRVGEVTYFGSQPWPLPASLMLGFTGRATQHRDRRRRCRDRGGAVVDARRVRGGRPRRASSSCRAASRSRRRSSRAGSAVRSTDRAGTERLSAGQSHWSQMPVAGSAMKQRGAQVVDDPVARGDAGTRRSSRAARPPPAACGASSTACPARARRRAASRRGCRSRAASAPCSLLRSRRGCRRP